MQKARGLAAVYVLDVRDVRCASWLQERLFRFASQLGLRVFDVYSDSYVFRGSEFMMFDQLVHDARHGYFNSVIVRWSPCMMVDSSWADRIRYLFELDVHLHMIIS